MDIYPKITRNFTLPLADIVMGTKISRYLNFYARCHIEDGFRRDIGDARDNMSGYATIDATMIAKKFLEGHEGLEIRGSVYNLLDKDYTTPWYPNLPNDVPWGGRSFLIELKYDRLVKSRSSLTN